MAKGKGSDKNFSANTPVESKIESLPIEVDPERFTALEYLIVNALFWLFCIINLWVARWFLGETTGLYFFFGMMAIGFSAACILSYLHDRFYKDDLPESESP